VLRRSIIFKLLSTFKIIIFMNVSYGPTTKQVFYYFFASKICSVSILKQLFVLRNFGFTQHIIF